MAQEVAALMIVALAALNLARIWSGSLASKKSDGCGKCGGCDSKPKPVIGNAPQLVQLQMKLKGKPITTSSSEGQRPV